MHTQRYVDGLALAENRLSWLVQNCQPLIGWWSTIGPLVGVSEVLPDIQTKNIDAAKTKATAGKYDDAMALLEGVSNRTNPVWKTQGEFDTFKKKWGTCNTLHGSANTTITSLTIPAPAIAARLASAKTQTLDASIATATPGNYVKALEEVTKFDTHHGEVLGLIAKHQQFQTDRATALVRINSLSHVDIATDKALVTRDRITAADGKVVTGDYVAALALLAKVDGECTLIAEYETKLTAAKTAVGLLTQPVIAKDKERIQKERIDAATALAAAWNHAGASVLLGKVADECAAATAVATGATETEAARLAAQTPINSVATAPDLAFKAVTDMVAALDGSGDLIKDDRENIRKKIALARTALTAPEKGDPKALLEQAAAECVAARAVVDRQAQYTLALSDANSKLSTLTETVITADKAKIKLDRIDKAAALVVPTERKYTEALAELAKVEAEVAAAKAVAAQDAAYKLALTAAELKLATLTDPLIATDKTTIETTRIDAAKTKVTTRLYPDATALLAKVEPECDVALKVVADEAAYKLKLAPVEDSLVKLTDGITENETVYSFVWQPMRDRKTDIVDNYINAAKTKAAARAYGAAESLLAQATPLLAAARTDSADLYWAFQEMYNADASISALELHGGAPGVATEIAAVKVLRQNAVDLRTAGVYSAANRLALEIGWACTAATKIAVQHAVYAPKLVTAKARMVTCTSKVGGLSPAVATISEKLKGVQTGFVDAAVTGAEGRDYAVATKLLDEVDAQCTAVELLVTQHGLYVAALAAAELDLAPLTQPVVADDVKRIRKDRVDAAKILVAALDYKSALALLAKVHDECTTAASVQTGNAAVAKGSEDTKNLLDGTPEGNSAALAEVEKLVKSLTEQHAARAAITDRTEPIVLALAAAKLLAPAEAKSKIEAIADQCVAVRELADRHVAYAAALTPAEGLVNGLSEPSMATDKAQITLDRITAAKDKAALHDYRGAMYLLEGVAADEAAARREPSNSDSIRPSCPRPNRR